MTEKKNNLVAFRAMPDMLTELDARDRWHLDESLGETARRDLGRYYALLERARRELRGRFCDNELSLLADCSNGTIYEPMMFGMLALNAADAVHLDHLDQKWGVDYPTMLGKLNNMTALEEWALIDAIERWWADDDRDEPATLLDESQAALREARRQS